MCWLSVRTCDERLRTAGKVTTGGGAGGCCRFVGCCRFDVTVVMVAGLWCEDTISCWRLERKSMSCLDCFTTLFPLIVSGGQTDTDKSASFTEFMGGREGEDGGVSGMEVISV